MVLRGMKPSRELEKKGRTASLVPLSPEERAIIEKVNACPVMRVPVDRLQPSAGHARRSVIHGSIAMPEAVRYIFWRDQ